MCQIHTTDGTNESVSTKCNNVNVDLVKPRKGRSSLYKSVVQKECVMAIVSENTKKVLFKELPKCPYSLMILCFHHMRIRRCLLLIFYLMDGFTMDRQTNNFNHMGLDC
jgi:hypothetical protein